MSVAVETFGFFMAAVGLLMLGVTLPNGYWRVSTVHGNVITTNTVFENLWYSCATDSLGVHNCWEFPSMLALSGTRWRVRGQREGGRLERAPGVWVLPGSGLGCHTDERGLTKLRERLLQKGVLGVASCLELQR